MRITSWKRAVGAGLVAIALASCSTGGDDRLFATAEPLAAAKPENFGFKHSIQIRNLEGLSETVRRNFSTVLQAEDFEQSLRRSLANDQMLAPKDGQAAYELTPYFVDLRTAPVSARVTAAQATFRYRVVRKEDGKQILDKRVKAAFSSIADPNFDEAGFFGRTLRLVGLGNDGPRPVAASFTEKEWKGPGPERESAREVHAARSAIALNIRKAVRQLIVASPERIVAPQPAGRGLRRAKPAPANPATGPGAAPQAADDGAPENDLPDTGDPQVLPKSGGNTLPPLAPAQNEEDESDG